MALPATLRYVDSVYQDEFAHLLGFARHNGLLGDVDLHVHLCEGSHQVGSGMNSSADAYQLIVIHAKTVSSGMGKPHLKGDPHTAIYCSPD